MNEVCEAVVDEMHSSEELYDARFARSILAFMSGVFGILGLYTMTWQAYLMGGIAGITALYFQAWVIPKAARQQQNARFAVGMAVDRLAVRANYGRSG